MLLKVKELHTSSHPTETERQWQFFCIAYSSSISKRNICMYFHTTTGLNQSVYLSIRMEQLQVEIKYELSLLGKEVQQYRYPVFF